MKLNVLVLEDEDVSLRKLVALLRSRPDVRNVSVCRDGHEALQELRNGAYDLAVLDIEVPRENGLSVAGNVPAHTRVIFTTAFADYAVQAFGADAADYVLKPYSRTRLYAAIERAKQELYAFRLADDVRVSTEVLAPAPGEPDRLILRTTEKIIGVAWDGVMLAMSESNYVSIFIRDQRHFVRGSLQRLEELAPPGVLHRVHRRALVNLAHMEEFVSTPDDCFLRLPGGLTAPVSRAGKRVVTGWFVQNADLGCR